jgi:hypothetical protein
LWNFALAVAGAPPDAVLHVLVLGVELRAVGKQLEKVVIDFDDCFASFTAEADGAGTCEGEIFEAVQHVVRLGTQIQLVKKRKTKD